MSFSCCLSRIVAVALCALSMTGTHTSSASSKSQSHVILSFEGVGPIKIGMSCARITKAGYTGCVGRDHDGDDVSSAPCVDWEFSNKNSERHLLEKHLLPRFGAQVRNGVVLRIDIGAPADAYTAEGIHIGSTEAEVRSAYGGHAREGRATIYSVETQVSQGVPRSAFLLKSEDGQRVILIETDGTKVVTIHVGVLEDFHVVREDGEVILEVPSCTMVLEGPLSPRGPASYP